MIVLDILNIVAFVYVVYMAITNIDKIRDILNALDDARKELNK